MADVIQIKPSARIKLQKNTGQVFYDQQFAPSAASYTSHVGQAIALATNSSVTLDMGNIVTAANALLQFDNPCLVRVNGQVTTSLSMVGTNSVWAAYSTSLTAIKIVNQSTTNTVTINYLLTN